MNIEDFFGLPIEEQERLVKVFAERKNIQRRWENIQDQVKELSADMERLQQESCKHPAVEIKHLCDEDDYGRRIPNSSYKTYYCPDCTKRWTVNDA